MPLPAFRLIPLKPGCNCLHHSFSDDDTVAGPAVTTGSDLSQPFSQAVSGAGAGAAGNTTFGAGAQPATAFGKPAGTFGSGAAPITFGNPTPSNSSQGAPVFGAAANQQSPFAGNPAGPINQSGMVGTSAYEILSNAALFAFPLFVGPTTHLGLAVSGAGEGFNDAALYAQVF